MPKKGFGSREAAEQAAEKGNALFGQFGVEFGVRSYTDPVTGTTRDDVVYRKPKKRAPKRKKD